MIKFWYSETFSFWLTRDVKIASYLQLETETQKSFPCQHLNSPSRSSSRSSRTMMFAWISCLKSGTESLPTAPNVLARLSSTGSRKGSATPVRYAGMTSTQWRGLSSRNPVPLSLHGSLPCCCSPTPRMGYQPRNCNARSVLPTKLLGESATSYAL